MIIKVFISMSNILPQSAIVDNVLSFTSAGLLFFDIIQQKFTIKRLLSYGVVALFALYTSSVTGQYGFLITVIAIMAISKSDFDKVLYFIYHWEILLFAAHTILALFWNLLPGTSIVQNIGGVERFNFGFGHPNTFSAYIFNLIIMWSWLHYKNITNKNIILILILGIVSYAFTRTRTSTLNIIIFCIIILIDRHFKNTVVFRNVAKIIVPVCSLIIYILITQFTTGSPFVLWLDQVLSGRIRLGAYAYYRYGITFFGQNISFTDVTWDAFWRLNDFTFDCTYTSLMIMQGTLWLFVLSIGFFLLGQIKDNRISIAIILWGLYAVTEVQGMNGFLCFPILLLTMLLKPKNQKGKQLQ